MPDVNYAELQKRMDDGTMTDDECHRLGVVHAAYSWACTPPGSFDERQAAIYRRGFRGASGFDPVTNTEVIF